MITEISNAEKQEAATAHGSMRFHHEFASKKLGTKRTVIVWLPPGYEAQAHLRYPVIYMHDGQNLFDPATAFAGVDWRVDETAEDLLRRDLIRPFIVVGMYNTPRREDEYTPRRGKKYAKFIIKEVKPFIDAHYRTLSGREHTAVMGSSLGGLISFYLAWWHPKVFGMAGCLSASWMWHQAVVFEDIMKDGMPKPGVKIYMDHGSEGTEGRYATVFKRMRDTLIKKGFLLRQDLEYFYGIGDGHDEGSWSRRVWRPLVFFFGKDRATFPDENFS
ncbi:MAG: alpha/beta hydrolase-fold protein [candidate division KSB1 bacterium]